MEEIKKQIKKLTKARGYVRGKATRTVNEVLALSLATVNYVSTLKYIEKLESVRLELAEMNKALFRYHMDAETSDEILDSIVNEEQDIDEKIFESLHPLKVHLINFDSTPVLSNSETSFSNQNNGGAHVPNRKLKVPDLPLPKFHSKNTESFRKFITSFEDIIGDFHLNESEKFAFLKDNVFNGPKTLLDSLSISKQKFSVAKDLLNKAFDDPTFNKFEVLEQLANLKLGYNDDPYNFMGSVQSIISEVEALDMHKSDFLQFFVWRGLNGKFQDQLISITNKSKPSLDEIIDKFFEAMHRYKRNKNESIKAQPRDASRISDTVSSAINVKSNKFCPLCKSDNLDKSHDIRDCRKYSTPQSKVSKLKALKGCIKCSYVNHSTADCKYKFIQPCRVCGREHMTFLCLSAGAAQVASGSRKLSATINSVEADAETEDAVASQMVVEVHHTAGCGSVILPTFTTEIRGDNSHGLNVRIFKDGGSQRNFITRALAKSLNLKVLQDNLKLKVRGFLSSELMTTEVVEVNLKIDISFISIPAV